MDSKQFDRWSRETNPEPGASITVEWVSVNREISDDVTVSFLDQSSRYCYCSVFKFCSFSFVNFVKNECSGKKLIEF